MYISISFGPNSKSYWNHITYHCSQFRAEQWALEQKCIGGCTGYVVIESEKDSWRVVDEMGTENVSISQVGSFFSIQPAPRLVMV